MPKLSALVPDRAAVDIPFGDDVLHVIFNPQRINLRFSNAAALAQRTQVVDEELIAQAAGLLVEWDLLDDESGEPISISAEALATIPAGVLARVMRAIADSPASDLANPLARLNGTAPSAPVLAGRKAR